MHKEKFIKSYLENAKLRLKYSKDALNNTKNYNYVIRECQTIVELCSKALLLNIGQIVPQKHDLKDELNEAKKLFSKNIQDNLNLITKTSKHLRRQREISLYGDEDLDLPPDKLYTQNEAKNYFKDTEKIFTIINKELTK